jgi:hypothetical protein
MDTENAGLISQEFSRLRAELERTGYGTVGVAFVIHDGKISRIIRTTEESAMPSVPVRHFAARGGAG